MRLLFQFLLAVFALFLLGSTLSLMIARQQPAVSASRIAFASNPEGQYHIYMMRTDGTHIESVTQHPADDNAPAWSPDGNWIAFSSNQTGSFDIYRIQPNGENRQRITQDASQDIHPAWSPDSQTLYFSSNRDTTPDIYKTNFDNQDTPVFQSDLQELKPALSPDGEWLAFVSSMDGNFDIYTLRANGTDLKNLTDNESWNTHPVWTKDGQWLVFASDQTGNFDIYKMRVDGSDVQNLMPEQMENPLSGTNSWDNYPTLSPDGKWIAFASDRDGDFDIYKMRLDGSAVQALTHTPFGESYPAWSPAVDLPWRVELALLVSLLCGGLLIFTWHKN